MRDPVSESELPFLVDTSYFYDFVITRLQRNTTLHLNVQRNVSLKGKLTFWIPPLQQGRIQYSMSKNHYLKRFICLFTSWNHFVLDPPQNIANVPPYRCIGAIIY